MTESGAGRRESVSWPVRLARWVWYAHAAAYLFVLGPGLLVPAAIPLLAAPALVAAMVLTWPVAFWRRWRAGLVVGGMVASQPVLAYAALGDLPIATKLELPAWIVGCLLPAGVTGYMLCCALRCAPGRAAISPRRHLTWRCS